MIKKLFNKVFIKYCFSGAIAALVELSAFYIFINIFGISYFYATPVSFLCGATLNYFLQRKFTFKSQYKKKHKQFAVFVIVAIGGLIVNWIATIAYTEVLGLDPIYSKLGAILTALIYNYTLNKKITFGKLSKQDDLPNNKD